ncbi:MAG: hypothetical protein AVDCRST_MAG67-408, partial [uncultured Solirubrobacteraceae bacterium]
CRRCPSTGSTRRARECGPASISPPRSTTLSR